MFASGTISKITFFVAVATYEVLGQSKFIWMIIRYNYIDLNCYGFFKCHNLIAEAQNMLFLDEINRNLGVNEILSATDKKLLGSVYTITHLHNPQHVSFHFHFELSRYMSYNSFY